MFPWEVTERHTCRGVAQEARDSPPVQSDEHRLQEAFGTGQGKHASKKRRRHSNKYAAASRATALDPWEEQLRQADDAFGEVEALERATMEAIQEKRRKRREERGEVIYPDEEDVDPYDPSTFGYIEVRGAIQVRCGYKSAAK